VVLTEGEMMIKEMLNKTEGRITLACEISFEFDPCDGFCLRVQKDEWRNFFTRTDKRRWRYRAAHFCSIHLITEAIFDWPSDVTDEEIELMVQIVELLGSAMDAAFVGHDEWRHKVETRRVAPVQFVQSRPSRQPAEKAFLYLMRHANGLTKIGRAVNPSAREKTLQAEDPRLEMIFSADGIGHHERRLHQIFADLRKRGEWFDLDDHHVEWIKFFFCGFSA